MVNGIGSFVYNGYDADGSWYPPEEPVIPRVYHEYAKDFNIKDILYPKKDEEQEEEPIVDPVDPTPVDPDPVDPTPVDPDPQPEPQDPVDPVEPVDPETP